MIARRMDVGQTVAASFAAPTIFEIAQDLTKMQLDTNVDESDIGTITVGQTATFTVDAYPGTTFRGQVSNVRKAPIIAQNVVTYDVVITVPNPDLKLFPGMTANAKILTAKARGHAQSAECGAPSPSVCGNAEATRPPGRAKRQSDNLCGCPGESCKRFRSRLGSRMANSLP